MVRSWARGPSTAGVLVLSWLERRGVLNLMSFGIVEKNIDSGLVAAVFDGELPVREIRYHSAERSPASRETRRRSLKRITQAMGRSYGTGGYGVGQDAAQMKPLISRHSHLRFRRIPNRRFRSEGCVTAPSHRFAGSNCCYRAKSLIEL